MREAKRCVDEGTEGPDPRRRRGMTVMMMTMMMATTRQKDVADQATIAALAGSSSAKSETVRVTNDAFTAQAFGCGEVEITTTVAADEEDDNGGEARMRPSRQCRRRGVADLEARRT